MKTLLIPVDFTNSSQNTIDFAIHWARKYLYQKIILLRSFYSSMYENMIMSADFSNVNEEYLNKKRTYQKELLNNLCIEVDKKSGHGIKVQTAVTELPLVRSIIEIVKTEQPQTIVLASDPAMANNESFVAGNIITIARLSPVRVLIVPDGYHYQEVKKALVPVDLKTVGALNKINSLHSNPRWYDVELMVLNIDATKSKLTSDKKFAEAENNLHTYLKNFQHNFYYEENKDVINGILNWPRLNEAQLMIALPGVHSFLYSLTHKSVSETLYRKCPMPVMILK